MNGVTLRSPEIMARALHVVHASTDVAETCDALLDIAIVLTGATGARMIVRPQADLDGVSIECANGSPVSLQEPMTVRREVPTTESAATHHHSAATAVVTQASGQNMSVILFDGALAIGELAVGREDGLPFTDSDSRVLQLLGSLMLQILDRVHRASELASERNHFKHLVEQIPAAVYLAKADASGTNLYVSPQVMDILGYAPDELLRDANLWMAITHPDDRERLESAHLQANVTGETWDIEYRARHRSGRMVWIHENAILINDESGTPLYWQGVLTDVTRRRQAEEDSLRSDADMRAVLESISDPFYAVDRDMRLTYLNEAMSQRLEQMYGVPRGQAIGRPLIDVMPGIRNSVTESRLRQTLRDGRVADFEVFLNAHKQWIAIRAYPSASGIAINVRDISAQRRLEARLTHQAFHDALTGLPNQTLLRHRIELALTQAQPMQRRVAVLMVDVNRFRVVNDSLGHAAGDELLIELGQRMMTCVRADDMVARFGGDTFAILLPSVEEIGNATEVAERVLNCMKASFMLSRRTVQATVSVGIAVSDAVDNNPDDLLRRADLALHRAKNAGSNVFAVFGRELHEAVMRRLDLEEALRTAVEQDGLEIAWQPIFDLQNGNVRHFEALTRWRDPVRGEVPPSEFIALAEDTGIIVALGRQVLLNACRQAVDWGNDLNVIDPTICVNISSREFREPDLVASIADTLRITGLPAQRLIIEITESLLMDDVDDSLERLLALKLLGIGIAIDDFGTGYSSLAYLHRLPVDVLKLDQRFILSLANSDQDRIIAGAAINLAHALGMVIVGEGVETQAQLQHLRALGADMAQGFYLSRPVGGESILRRHRAYGRLPSET